MLSVFAAALACSLIDDGAPTNAHLSPSVDSDARDADGDGYDASVDCDDQDRDVHPGTTETCANERDDNCNGTADGCDWSGPLVLEGTELTTTDSEAALGTTLAVCDANGDGVGDVVVGAPGSYIDTVAVYVFYGPIRGDRNVQDADYTLLGTGTEKMWTGLSVDCRRDVDSDGVADIIVGEPGRRVGNVGPGAVYVVPGGGTGRLPIADEATSTWIGSDGTDRLGYQLVAIDVDGDETDELAATITVPNWGPHAFGATYLFEDTGPGERDADAATAYVYGEQGDRLDVTVGNAGDLDGDGLEELVLTGNDPVVEEVLVFRPPFFGPVPKSDADVRIVGGPPGTALWSGIGHADLDDDGRDDLFFGNPTYYPYGEVYAFFSPIESTRAARADMRIVGTAVGYGAGSDVTSPGDVDGDGSADLLVGAAWGDVVFLQYGDGRGVYDLAKDAQASWQQDVFFEHSALAGITVAAGDVTGDGVGEFLIGAPAYGNLGEGSVTIVPGFNL